MARVTPNEVKAILGDDYDTLNNPSLTPRITTANVITNRLVLNLQAKGTTLTDEELKQIELHLAAWAYCMSDKPYDYKQTDATSAKFSGQTDKGLQANLYGQVALVLDPTGTLSSLFKQEIGLVWAGVTEAESLDWDARN